MIPMEVYLLMAKKILLSIFLGMIIGYDMQIKQKITGMKSNIMICLGSTLFTIVSIHIPGMNDSARVIAQIVPGIGFLGAGTIFINKKSMVSGITTASTIWVVAALGIFIGLGYIIIPTMTTLIIISVLNFIPSRKYTKETKSRSKDKKTFLV